MTPSATTAAPDAQDVAFLGEGSQNSPRPFPGPLAKRTVYVRVHNPAHSTDRNEPLMMAVSLAAEPWGKE
jgi:hypothetical protein